MSNVAMPPPLTRLLRKWREHGLLGLARRQAHGFRCRLMMNPAWHRLVAGSFRLRGDRIPFRGQKIYVGDASITAEARALIYYGIYEHCEVDLALGTMDRSLPLVELGGSIGVVACTLNRALERPDRHVVVEANPRLIPLLEENRRANGARFEILHAAVGYGGPTVQFTLGDSVSGAIRDTGGVKVEVPTISLARIIEDRGLDRLNLVMDVEGAEVEIVENELETLASHVQCLVMEAHERFVGEGPNARMFERLESAGFVVTSRSGAEVVAMTNRRLASVPTGSIA